MPLKLSNITFKKHHLAEGLEEVSELLEASGMPSYASMQHANVQFGNRWSMSIIRNMPKPSFAASSGWKLVYEVAVFTPEGEMIGPQCFNTEEEVETLFSEIMAKDIAPAK